MDIALKNRRPTYHRRLFVGLVIYSVVMMALIGIFQYSREKEVKAEVLNEKLQLVNDRIISQLQADSLDSYEGALSAVAAMLPDSDLRINIIDLSGRVLFDNSLDSLPSSNHLDRKEVADALQRGSGYTIRRHSAEADKYYFYSAKRSCDLIVRTAVPYSLKLQDVLSPDGTFLWITAIITLLMCVLGYYATRKLGRMVERLNNFAERAERGERIFDNEPFPHDELGEISNHIVRLYANLQNVQAERDREHREALRQEQEKILIKRQLSNNINHELKTPIASIQVCVETLLNHPDMDAAKREDFLKRCYANSDRLKRMLSDVSTITRIEDGAGTIAREPVRVDSVVADVCEQMSVLASDKGMTIENHVTYNLPLKSNTTLLESIFHNLIENALAYSQGTKVVIDQRDDSPDWLTISVSDNGTGVPDEHLPRIFERFYRVDKGRSRSAGGTGLGLAIVKNAVLWHGGTISAVNLHSGGLCVTFTLPKV